MDKYFPMVKRFDDEGDTMLLFLVKNTKKNVDISEYMKDINYDSYNDLQVFNQVLLNKEKNVMNFVNALDAEIHIIEELDEKLIELSLLIMASGSKYNEEKYPEMKQLVCNKIQNKINSLNDTEKSEILKKRLLNLIKKIKKAKTYDEYKKIDEDKKITGIERVNKIVGDTIDNGEEFGNLIRKE